MYEIQTNGSKNVLVFKHLEQVYLNKLQERHVRFLQKKYYISIYFGGPHEVTFKQADFLVGLEKNILRNITNIPVIELSGASFIPNVNVVLDKVRHIDVITLMNHARHKRHEDFVLFANSNPHLSSLLFTYGPRHEYEQLIERLNDNVSANIFFGTENIGARPMPWDEDIMQQLYAQSRYFLLTSFTEGVNRAAVQAAMCGCIIVLSKDLKGGTKDFLCQNGFDFVEYGNITELGTIIDVEKTPKNYGVQKNLLNDSLSALQQRFYQITGDSLIIPREHAKMLHRYLPSHGTLIDRKYVNSYDMYKGISAMKRYFGFKVEMVDMTFDLKNRIIRKVKDFV
jgi:hypothetical protein